MTPQVRLRDSEVLAIIQCFKEHFKGGDHLWLFGSRTRMDQKGGDIDLYVETAIQNWDVITPLKFKFLVATKTRIGDQRIDLIIKPSKDPFKPIHLEAKETGVLLV